MAGPRVFLSYCRDNITEVSRLCDALRSAGLEVFWDQDIEPGKDWREAVDDALAKCDRFLACFSRETEAREESGIYPELQDAIERVRKRPPGSVFLIPVRLSNCAIPSLRINDTTKLEHFQRVELFPAAQWETGVRRLIEAIRKPEAMRSQPPAAAVSLAPPGEPGACPRDQEMAYLKALQTEQPFVQSAGRVYVKLAGEESRFARLNVAEEVMPTTFVHEKRRELGDRLAKPMETSRFEDIREALTTIRSSKDPGRLALLGEPGSGKSYTLGRVALELAQQAEGATSAPLPVLVQLGQWIRADQDAHAGLDAFIAEHLGVLTDWYPALRRDGRLALLLDGLNEIPGDQRKTKSAAIWALTQDANFPLVIVSCRVKDFETHDTRLDLDTLTIEPLAPPKVRTFINRYLASGEDQAAKAQAEELFWYLAGGGEIRQMYQDWLAVGLTGKAFWSSTAIPNIRPGLKRLLLPWCYFRWRDQYNWLRRADDGRRSQLEDVRSLLKLAERPYFLMMMVMLYLNRGTAAFEGNRSALFQRFVNDVIEREDKRHREKNNGDPHPGRSGIEDALGRLAWIMQNTAAGPDKVRLALTPAEAEKQLTAAQRDLAQGTGLLDWQASVRFTHQLLQEYFASLGMRVEIDAGRLVATGLWPAESWWERTGWEEAAVFLAGSDPEEPTWIVDWLKDAQPEVLIQCIEQNGLRLNDSVKLPLRKAWLSRLVDVVREPNAKGRAAIGRALGSIELEDGTPLDNRPGVGLNAQGIPHIDWVKIPDGEVKLEGEDRSFAVNPFRIARYTVTHVQFQAFIDAEDGYRNPKWWKDIPQSEEPSPPEWRYANHPRESVSWYDAIAFCDWLTEKYGLDENQKIRLPTEWEWQQAASGGESKSEYPWGAKWDAARCNSDESGIGQTTAVGLYPHGTWEDGPLDMAGNVLEWCLNKYDKPEANDALRIDKSDVVRVIRGGSWFLKPGSLRSAYRYRDTPGLRSHGIGFRLAQDV